MHNMTFRFPVVPTRLGRFEIAAGDPVMVSPAAAHTCPHFTGSVGGGAAAGALFTSRAHLSFGAGPHRCPAQDLAFMIVGIGIERLFARFEKVELAMPADQLPWRSSPLFSGLRALPVRYLLTEGQRQRWGAAALAPGLAVAEGYAYAEESPEAERPERQSPFWRLMASLRRRARRG